jgi:hypothetical protein
MSQSMTARTMPATRPLARVCWSRFGRVLRLRRGMVVLLEVGGTGQARWKTTLMGWAVRAVSSRTDLVVLGQGCWWWLGSGIRCSDDAGQATVWEGGEGWGRRFGLPSS